MRVLVASTSGAGHLGPLLPFAEALAEDGDEVRRLVGDPAPPAFWDSFARLSRDEQAILANREWFGRRCTAAMQPEMERACAAFAPDLIVREPCEFASAIAARQHGIECMTVACSLAAVEWGALDLIAPVLPGGTVEALRAAPYLTRFPASIDPSPFQDTRRYREATTPPTSDGSLIYASFGTAAAGARFDPYRVLLEAVDGLDVRVLLTTGDEIDLGPVPRNVRVERWVPQAEALAHASLVVCHGGSGTVLGALAANVPLVILPLFADQFANARALAGAAAVVIGPDELRAAILSPPARRRRSRASCTTHRRASQRFVELPEQRSQALELGRAEPLVQTRLELGHEVAHDGEDLAATRRRADELGTAVGGIGDALEVPVALEVLDQLRHRLLGHPGAQREVADAGTGVVEVLEDIAVRVTDLGVPALREPFDQLLGHRPERLPQQDREVLRLAPGGRVREVRR